MGKIVHLEITADDTDRAIKFYKDAFGWMAEKYMDGYFVVKTGEGEGIDGAIMSRDFQPQPMIGWVAVDDVDVAIQKVKDAGGEVFGEKQMLEGTGEVVYANDTEGNLFGIIKPEPRNKGV